MYIIQDKVIGGFEKHVININKWKLQFNYNTVYILLNVTIPNKVTISKLLLSIRKLHKQREILAEIDHVIRWQFFN